MHKLPTLTGDAINTRWGGYPDAMHHLCWPPALEDLIENPQLVAKGAAENPIWQVTRNPQIVSHSELLKLPETNGKLEYGKTSIDPVSILWDGSGELLNFQGVQRKI